MEAGYIIDLGAAFRSFFDRRGRYPRFKRRGVRDGFCAANEVGNSVCDGRRIKLPRVGSVRMREALRFPGQPRRVTVSREADRWFASVLVEVADPAPLSHPEPCVGVDLGITTLATLSTGETVPGPRAHKALLGRLRRTSRGLSRKRKGSANRAKAKRRLARLHARIAAIRRDATHNAVTSLARRFARIGIEELERAGDGGQPLARALDHGRRLRGVPAPARLQGPDDRRAGRGGRPVIHPSSEDLLVLRQRWRTELALSQRTFRCDACGHEADRDLNAARNLEHLAASFAVTACGEGRSGPARKGRVKRSSAKQELDGEAA